MQFTGVKSAEAEILRQKYGSNKLTQLATETLAQKIIKGFKDPMIMILLVALAVQLILFALGQAEWFEPVGILIAIIIANGVAAVSENNQENKAAALKAAEEARELTKVIRDGYLQEIHVDDIVKGDIVYLQAGDKIPADGLMQAGLIEVDQASLNGETDEAEKVAYPQERPEYDANDLLNAYYVYRGTIVCGGEGYFAPQAPACQTASCHQ